MSFFKLCVQYHALMKYMLRCKDVGVKFDLNNRVSCVMCADAFITWPLWFDSKIQTHRSYFQNLLTLIAEALHGAHNNLAINTFNFILFVVIQIDSWSAWIVLKYSFYHSHIWRVWTIRLGIVLSSNKDVFQQKSSESSLSSRCWKNISDD